MSTVTDPNLIARLNQLAQQQPAQSAQQPTEQPTEQGGDFTVTDPDLIAKLNGLATQRGQQGAAQQGQQGAAQQPEEPGFFDGLGGDLRRQAGLGGRAMAKVVPGLLDIVYAPSAYIESKVTGKNVPTLTQRTEQYMDERGVPEPKSWQEKLAGFGMELTGEAAAGRGVAKLAEGGIRGLAGLVAGSEGLGGVVKGLSSGARNAAERLPGQVDHVVPTVEGLETAAGEAYKRAEDAGVLVNPESFAGNVVVRMGNMIREQGGHPGLTPAAETAMKHMVETVNNYMRSGRGIPLKEIQVLREIIGNVSASVNKKEQRIGRMMTEMLDDYVDNMGTPDLIEGAGRTAAKALKEARGLWQKKSNVEMIEGLHERAAITAGAESGHKFQKALRNEFKRIAKNKKEFRRLPVELQEAITIAAKGGPMTNAMDLMSTLAPTNLFRGAVLTTTGIGIDPMLAAGMAGAGVVGQKAARSAMKRKADAVMNAASGDQQRLTELMDPNVLAWLFGGATASVPNP